jgi:transposase
MDCLRLATYQKKASRLAAHLVFLDESGFFMSPLVQRDWAPVGVTPTISPRTRHHQSVSVTAAITISPQRKRLNLLMQLYPDQSIEQDHVLAFLRAMRQQLRGHIVLIWDRLAAHRSTAVQQYLASWNKLHQESLPAYAPELNPVEYLWSWLKRADPLANGCPQTIEEITQSVIESTQAIPTNRSLLRSFVRATKLSIKFNS